MYNMLQKASEPNILSLCYKLSQFIVSLKTSTGYVASQLLVATVTVESESDTTSEVRRCTDLWPRLFCVKCKKHFFQLKGHLVMWVTSLYV